MSLRATLAGHAPGDDQEAFHLRRILEFVDRHRDPFDRRLAEGHLTGSAFVVSDDGARVLLVNHRKLGRWMQPGGHAEPGEASAEAVALREAREETGLDGLRLHPAAPRPLDVDVHAIPAWRDEGPHDHLDLRFLVLAPYAPPAAAGEVRWFGWAELPGLDLDAGLCRGLAKARGFWR